tara:strand:- start:800 stop:1279 length:480 start_codon:yes stop_codon:yes gene_type:complete
MKKLIKGALFLALVGTVIVGCEKEESQFPIGSTEINPTKTKSANNKSNLEDYIFQYNQITITISYDTLSELVTWVSLNSEAYDLIDMTPQEFFDEVENSAALEGSPHSACIKECRDEYLDENGDRQLDENGNKKKGYGGCRTNCWVDTTVRVLDALIPG